MRPTSGISVIVCCFNSNERIKATLKHLSKQIIEEYFKLEIIIVDNGSTDNTINTVKETWYNITDKFCKIELKIVTEPKPGLQNARKKGIKESKYDYIIFCDDDNWLDEEFTVKAYNILKTKSNISLIGSLGRPVFETDKPEWFDFFENSYAVGPQSLKSNTIVNYVYGAGLVIRKKDYLELLNLPVKEVLTGRKQHKLLAGDDSEICCRARLLNFKIIYCEDLKFQHYISKERLNWSYLKKLQSGFAKSSIYLNVYEHILQEKTLSPIFWINKPIINYLKVIKFIFLHPQIIFNRDMQKEKLIISNLITIANENLILNFRVYKFYRELKSCYKKIKFNDEKDH